MQYITERYPHIREIGKPLSPQGTVYVTLCFGDENSDYLIKENRQIEAPATPAGKATALIQELIAGPRAKGTATMPQGVKLRGIKIEDDMLVVDFSQELVTRHPGGSTSEMMTVFSLVNTITMNIPEIKKVKFLVEGKPIETIAGHIDCSEPIQPQFGLVH
ncbi:MAG: GerMN domain-containing protein [Desulfobacterota bacterium]|nr:GerMN domain-containing protein [Thermodesulfobacteriota bacterium]